MGFDNIVTKRVQQSYRYRCFILKKKRHVQTAVHYNIRLFSTVISHFQLVAFLIYVGFCVSGEDRELNCKLSTSTHSRCKNGAGKVLLVWGTLR